jgi:hypothetical protein
MNMRLTEMKEMIEIKEDEKTVTKENEMTDKRKGTKK